MCTPAIKSPETQFCKPVLASETLPKPMKWATEVYDFSLQLFWQAVELKLSSYEQITPVLWIQPKWISAPGQTVSRASKVS
jgi:hypothetical protein